MATHPSKRTAPVDGNDQPTKKRSIEKKVEQKPQKKKTIKIQTPSDTDEEATAVLEAPATPKRDEVKGHLAGDIFQPKQTPSKLPGSPERKRGPRKPPSVNLEQARLKLPHLDLSIVDGVLIVKERTPADLLSDLSIDYATTFQGKHQSYLDILADQLLNQKEAGLATIAPIMQALLTNKSDFLFLLITVILAYTKADLTSTTTSLLSRVHKVESSQLIVAPVTEAFKARARKLFGHIENSIETKNLDSNYEEMILKYVDCTAEEQDSKIVKVLGRIDLQSMMKGDVKSEVVIELGTTDEPAVVKSQ